MKRASTIVGFCSLMVCLGAPASARAGTALTTVRVASGLARPTLVTFAPGDFERVFILEQHIGNIRILNLTTGTLNAIPFLIITDLSTGSEQGLLGLAFHPDYQNNGWFYVNYTNAAGTTIVERYQVSADPNIADGRSGRPVISYAQPFTNHNGGWLGFGPNDGYLYISAGDGGSAGDPGNRAQDITDQLLGKILRLDVNGDDFPADDTRNYAIPPANPFVGITGDDEIWAYGLRNPWRCAFDRDNGDLYIADVGQNAWEEIDYQPAASGGGENYGWRCYEGDAPYNTIGCPPASTMVFPIHVYSHASGCSVTGGYVYRGCAIPSLQGTYFFGDYCSAQIWSFRYDGVSMTEFTNRTTELDPPSFTINLISSFGEDAFGEMYICDLGGEIFKIVPAAGVPDGDSDGVTDLCDNCSAAANSDQADLDSDGLGDVCDPDADGDGFEGPLGANVDCNDLDPMINPGAEESVPAGNCADTVDNDCDGSTDAADPGCGPLCVCGDIDGSGGVVNLTDFATFALCFDPNAPNPSCDAAEFACSDLNGDGDVNLVDLSTFTFLFGSASTNSPPDCLP